MRLIAITLPEMTPGEDERIVSMLSSHTFWRVHIRKPDASADRLRQLLDRLPTWCHPQLVLHDHFELCHHYTLGGIHLNHRNPDIPHDLTDALSSAHHSAAVGQSRPSFTVSCSCHSFDEVRERKAAMDYLFLSPIFDSISKRGYLSQFSSESLQNAAKEGLIDGKVFALGGVTQAKLPLLYELGFGGAAMLGAAWQDLETQSSL